jgi:hypothetical protein
MTLQGMVVGQVIDLENTASEVHCPVWYTESDDHYDLEAADDQYDDELRKFLNYRNEFLSMMVTDDPMLSVLRLHLNKEGGSCTCGKEGPCPTQEVLFRHYFQMRLDAEATVPDGANALKVGAL